MSVKNSLILRISALCIAMVSITTLLMGAAILWIFTQSSNRILDNHLMAYTDIIVSQIEVKDNAVILQDDAQLLANLPRYWQISEGDKPLYKSKNLNSWIPLLPENTQQAQRLVWQRSDGQEIVALQTTFLFPHDRKITLISGLDHDVATAYKLQERAELANPLYRILLLAGLVLIIMCVSLTYYVLRPFKTIKHAMQSIRAGKTQRIDGAYPTEIKALTDEINHLLDYTSGSIAKHREFSSNLAHTLKTPLTVIANETDVTVIKTKLRHLMDIIERSLARVHAAGTSNILSATTPILPVLTDICDGFGRVYGKHIDIDYPDDILFKGDRADLYEILGNIIENAGKFSQSHICISESHGAIVIEDDGKGIPETEYAHVLKRGARLDESKPGTGIGLAVAHDIIALYQGDLQLQASTLGGLKVLIKLPIIR